MCYCYCSRSCHCYPCCCYLGYYAGNLADAHGFSWPCPCLGPLLMSKGMDLELIGISCKTRPKATTPLPTNGLTQVFSPLIRSLISSPNSCQAVWSYVTSCTPLPRPRLRPHRGNSRLRPQGRPQVAPKSLPGCLRPHCKVEKTLPLKSYIPAICGD